ncbi:MAG: hypothetical protein JNL32_16545 [Candidatus Kapabacteria bacterium]|nr:hypothetical protein [Candidatus Kapabacteria bacterium]
MQIADYFQHVVDFRVQRRCNHLLSDILGVIIVGMIPPGGFLVSSSCSHHITEEMLMEVITHESCRINRRLKLVHRGMQLPCHPIYLHMPETAYLKFFVFEVW